MKVCSIQGGPPALLEFRIDRPIQHFPMITEELLSHKVPILEPRLTAAEALDLMAEVKIPQLPLVDDGHYRSLIDEVELEALPRLDLRLSQTEIPATRPFLASSSHPFEAFRLVHELDLKTLPVLDHEDQYLGSITPRELLRYAAENSGWDIPGGILVFQLPSVQYSMHRIALICEEESMTILGVQVRSHAQAGWTEVTLKLHRNDLDGLVQALERHGYKVMEVYGDQPRKEEVMERYQLLMNYINM